MAKKKLHHTAVKPRTWSRTLFQLYFGMLVVDLATYFEWAWYTFPAVFIGLFLMNDAMGRKVLGLKTGGNVLLTIGVFLVFVAVKIWAPEMLRTWEDYSTPLKWILP